jgi:SAM-dependent methyltransferase
MPVVGPALSALRRVVTRATFQGSGGYWEDRYRTGGTSGDGSYGRLASFKAEVLNAFVGDHGVERVLELGCGDGGQLSLADYPSYVGLDVSPTAIALCDERFVADATKTFAVLDPQDAARWARTAPLALSLDVVYHLVEDDVYETYMNILFDAATEWVIVYSSNTTGRPAPHVRHRRFTDWVTSHRPEWRLMERIPNPFPGDGESATSFADFYVFARSPREPRSDIAPPVTSGS